VEEPNPAVAPITSDTKATMKNNMSSPNMIQISASVTVTVAFSSTLTNCQWTYVVVVRLRASTML
jgi:hypothetical protein